MAALTAAAVIALASQYPNWDVQKVDWLVFKESSRRPDVINPAGPWYGLMQIGEREGRQYGVTPEQLLDPEINIRVGYQLWQDRGWQPWPIASSYQGEQMEVTADGWLTFAERKPGPTSKVNEGVNPVTGIVFHSAEGFEAGLWSQLASAPVSWHLSNMFDGKLYQHYPLTSRCWHATAFNQFTIGMEHEGRSGQPLTDAQIATSKRVVAAVSEWKGWTPERPFDINDKTASLWEHREVVRFGGSASTCPNGRIPWDLILEEDMPAENYPNELDERRARELLWYQVYNGKIKVLFNTTGTGLVVIGTDGKSAPVATDVPPFVKPSIG